MRAAACDHLVRHFATADSLVPSDYEDTGYDETTIEKIRTEFKHSNLPLNELGEASEANGDLLLDFGVLKDALTAYLLSVALYKRIHNSLSSGIIENKIASLYLKKPYIINIKKAVDHYEKAEGYFYEIGDSIDAITEELKICKLQFEIPVADLNYNDIGLVGAKKHLGPKASMQKDKKINLDRLNNENKRNTYLLNEENALEASIQGFRFYNKKNFWGELNMSNCILIGNYFFRKNDLETAQKYFQLAFIYAAITNYPNYNSDNVINTLNQVCFMYIKTGNYSRAIELADKAIAYCAKENNSYQKAWLFAIKGTFYLNIGIYSEAIIWLNNAVALETQHKILFPGEKGNSFLEYAYASLSKAYDSIGNSNSKNYYAGESNRIKANTLSDLDELNTIEADFTEGSYEDEIDTLDAQEQKLQQGNRALLLGRLGLLHSADSLNTMNINSAKDIASKAVLLNRQNVTIGSQDLTIRNNKKKLDDTFFYVGIFSGIALLIFGLTVYTYRLRIKRRNEKILITRAELNTLAKGKLHNLKNKYSSIFDLIDDNDFDKAKAFAEKSANYLALALTDINWERTRCTIKQEIDLLYAYYDSEKIIWPNVIINNKIQDAEVYNALFVTEVFTTLLHNSILHGFQNKPSTDDCVFTLKARRENDWIHFEITDNGYVPDKTIQYIIPAKPDKGLSLIRRRIETEIRSQNKYKEGMQFFSAQPKEDEGSIIKFIFPYATASRNNYRGKRFERFNPFIEKIGRI